MDASLNVRLDDDFAKKPHFLVCFGEMLKQVTWAFTLLQIHGNYLK